MTPDEAIEQASRGQLLPVYVVSGEERLLRDRVIAALREAALGGGIPDFNEDKFTAGEVDVDKILSAVKTVPMMANKRFCLVRNVDKWESSGGGGGSDDDDAPAAVEASKLPPIEKLALYTESPIESTCLVLASEKLDGRRKLMTVARKKGFLVSCDPLDDRALAQFIARAAKTRGNPISPDVAELLASIAGPELGHVEDAVERLSLYAGAGAAITEDAVSECVARVRMADTFALVDAVRARDLGRALRLFSDVYEPRDHGLPLLGLIAWSVRQLARVAVGIEAGQRPDDAARNAGVTYRAYDVIQRAKGFRARELERWLVVLKDADLALKSSRRPADAILEEALTRMIRRAA